VGLSVFVWAMIGIAFWHFSVLVPDRFWGGIIGAFLAALAQRSQYSLRSPPGSAAPSAAGAQLAATLAKGPSAWKASVPRGCDTFAPDSSTMLSASWARVSVKTRFAVPRGLATTS
jgi:hypothetical protein